MWENIYFFLFLSLVYISRIKPEKVIRRNASRKSSLTYTCIWFWTWLVNKATPDAIFCHIKALTYHADKNTVWSLSLSSIIIRNLLLYLTSSWILNQICKSHPVWFCSSEKQWKIKPRLAPMNLVHPLIFSHPSRFAYISQSSLAHLQLVQNAAAWLLTKTGQHFTLILASFSSALNARI